MEDTMVDKERVVAHLEHEMRLCASSYDTYCLKWGLGAWVMVVACAGDIIPYFWTRLVGGFFIAMIVAALTGTAHRAGFEEGRRHRDLEDARNQYL